MKLLSFLLLPLILLSSTVLADKTQDELIHEFLKVTRAAENYREGQIIGMKAGLDGQGLSAEETEKMEEILIEFFDEFLSFEALFPVLVEEYRIFSNEELEELIAFYRTDLGQKIIEQELDMIENIVTASMQMLEENQHILIQRIEAAF